MCPVASLAIPDAGPGFYVSSHSMPVLRVAAPLAIPSLTLEWDHYLWDSTLEWDHYLWDPKLEWDTYDICT